MSSSRNAVWHRGPCGLSWLDRAKDRLRLDRLDARADGRLSSPGLRPFLARQGSLPSALKPAQRARASSIAFGLPIAIEAATVAGSQTSKEITMAQIGSFTRGEDGAFTGTIKTLSLNIKARMVPAEPSQNEKAPDLRVLSGNVEIGAAWKRTSKENTVYHSVKLDDPSFTAPIYANLVEVDGGYSLVWSR
jgi:uncharacterized protein (DUF736 family)